MGKLIITADDYGACQFIDDGIERAIDGGHINTVSAFVTHKKSKDSIKRLLKKRESNLKGGKNAFNIGLHFSITSGFSLQKKDTTLTNIEKDGDFYFFEAKNYPFNSIDENDLYNEVIAQLTKLDEMLDEVLIDHITVHHGITYLDSDLYEVFIKAIADYKGPVGKNKYEKPISMRSPQSWFRAKDVPNCCYDPETGDKMLLSEIITEGFELRYWKKLKETTNTKMQWKKARAAEFNIKSTDYLVDVIYDQCCSEGLNCLFKVLASQDITAEFMFHLGYQTGADDVAEWDFENKVEGEHGINKKYFYRRMWEELKTIEDINLASQISKFKIQKISYSDL